MTKFAKLVALNKLAYFGYAPVVGAPSFPPPPMTVGQVMYNANGPYSPLSMHDKRNLNNQIVNTGVNVNAPAKSLLHAGIGALAGNFIANALGAGPFMRGVATALGGSYGYNK